MFDRTLMLPGGSDHMAPHLICAAAFLLNYPKQSTREEYTSDLRMYFNWCTEMGIDPLAAQRYHVQGYARWLADVRGLMPATIGRRMGTLSGYYDTAQLDGYVAASPYHHIKLPKVINDPTARVWLTRFELGVLLKTARDSGGADWALIAIMATLGMRVSATCAIQIEDITLGRDGYRILRTVGKGDKPSNKAIPIPVCMAIDAAAGGRTRGPLLRRRDGSQMTRRSAATIVTRLCRQAGIDKKVTPHSLRRSFCTLALMAGIDLRVVQDGMDHANPKTTMIYDAAGIPPHGQASHAVAQALASVS